MKLSEKKSGNFAPHPEYNGNAVCVDVTPPEVKQTDFGPKEKFRLVFETEAKNEKGEPCHVWSSGFTTSLNEKASFRKFLRQWFGRDLNAQELSEFDTESLINKPAFLVVTHSNGDNGETYANIAACTPCRGEPLKPSGKFTRKKDRDANKAAGGGGANGEGSQYRAAQQKSGAGDDAPVGRENWMTVKVHVGRNAGVDLGDLDEAAVKALIANWLPVYVKMPKPLVADKRLAEALDFAKTALEEAAKAPPTTTPAAEPPPY